MKDSGGPYVAVAVLCENVLEEKDGVLSLLRVVDRWIITAQGPDAPDQLKPQQIEFRLVLGLKAGRAKGRHSLVIKLEQPSGEFLPTREVSVLFEAEDRGVNFMAQVFMLAAQEGVYWFHVFLDGDQFLTKVPFRVVYQPIRTAAPPTA